MLENLSSLLLVRSSRSRDLLADLLSPHFQSVAASSSIEEATDRIAGGTGFDLLLSDVYLPDGDAFDLLRRLPDGTGEGPTPKVILMAAPWRASEAAMAEQLGAIAYLPKPIGLEEIVARVWHATHSGQTRVRPRQRRRSLSRARIFEPGGDGDLIASSGLHNVSMSGAFLETRGPLPIGAKILLETVLGSWPVRAPATVVRVQEPSWIHVSGVGVRFDWMDDRSSDALRRFIYGEPQASPAQVS
jgi:CheY-like chemotaxis protein